MISVFHLYSNKKFVEYDYAYISSSLPSLKTSRAELFLTDKEGNVKEKIKLGKAEYNKILIDSSGKIHTIGSNENIEYVYDPSINKVSTYTLGTTDNGLVCKGKVYIMFEIDGKVASILNYGNLDDSYMNLVKYDDKCYEVPLLLRNYDYDEEKQIIHLEGYKKLESDHLNKTQPEYLRYEINLKEKKVTKLDVVNQEEYTPAVNSSYQKNYIKDDIVYSTLTYYDKETINTQATPNNIIYLVKRSNIDYKVLEKKKIDKLTYGHEEDQNNDISALFYDDKYYYLRYFNERTYLEIYDLELNLLEKLDITRDEWLKVNKTGINKENRKLYTRYTRIINGKLHFIMKNVYEQFDKYGINKSITHYVYDFTNKQYENVLRLDLKYQENHQFFDFDVKKTN